MKRIAKGYARKESIFVNKFAVLFQAVLMVRIDFHNLLADARRPEMSNFYELRRFPLTLYLKF
ncbi:hypothetical protein [Brucella intermedia]|uniref:hypothetical protein n=1 Tax=Brucella intermedia TaxID=94625 RepID=UPI000C289AC0|nr:hypothetical protein [Brucella intermedia]PJR94610.1 hypothetical protein CN881_03145 [Ochrobactrum sp. 721/2009]PJT17895.1 hypothetical protein CN880_04610 [Ochrobactrum sp. 720/2009]PJT20971.1 hypothetical protein CN879_15945 [Ochrobactrum sp. 715/2009]PJT31230.1 hypothetical protein CN878_07810 [Ochrobactrum sp. 695/2009]PJT33256.1 hypothetical protein CN877_17815 [Ochrobactrum sp. 689/2009]